MFSIGLKVGVPVCRKVGAAVSGGDGALLVEGVLVGSNDGLAVGDSVGKLEGERDNDGAGLPVGARVFSFLARTGFEEATINNASRPAHKGVHL